MGQIPTFQHSILYLLSKYLNLHLIDIGGKKIKSWEHFGSKQYNVSGLRKGLYFILIESDNKIDFLEKIVINNQID